MECESNDKSLILSESNLEFGFDLDEWEYSEHFGEKRIPVSLPEPISIAQKTCFIFLVMDMGMFNDFTEIVHLNKK